MLPQPSVAVYVTGVVPIGKLPPFGIPLVKVAVAVPVVQFEVGTGAVHVATALVAPAAVVKVIFAGQVMLILLAPAVTTTSNEQVVDPPQPSVAVYVTVVVPIGKLEPLAGPPVCATVAPPPPVDPPPVALPPQATSTIYNLLFPASKPQLPSQKLITPKPVSYTHLTLPTKA